jgi:hypothetical protein
MSELCSGKRPTTGLRCTPALQRREVISTFSCPRSLAKVSIFRFRLDASVSSSSKIRPDISTLGIRLRANSAAWEMAPVLMKSTEPRSILSPKGTAIGSKFQLEEIDGAKNTASDGLRSGNLGQGCVQRFDISISTDRTARKHPNEISARASCGDHLGWCQSAGQDRDIVLGCEFHDRRIQRRGSDEAYARVHAQAGRVCIEHGACTDDDLRIRTDCSRPSSEDFRV